jgi:hypothetical protein
VTDLSKAAIAADKVHEQNFGPKSLLLLRQTRKAIQVNPPTNIISCVN